MHHAAVLYFPDSCRVCDVTRGLSSSTEPPGRPTIFCHPPPTSVQIDKKSVQIDKKKVSIPYAYMCSFLPLAPHIHTAPAPPHQVYDTPAGGKGIYSSLR